MTYTITVRGRLRGPAEQIRAAHDASAKGGGRDQALALGELHHTVYINPQDGQEVLMIDQWKSVEAFKTFTSSPEIQGFFGQAFEKPPEVVVWTKSDWMEW